MHAAAMWLLCEKTVCGIVRRIFQRINVIGNMRDCVKEINRIAIVICRGYKNIKKKSILSKCTQFATVRE